MRRRRTRGEGERAAADGGPPQRRQAVAPAEAGRPIIAGFAESISKSSLTLASPTWLSRTLRTSFVVSASQRQTARVRSPRGQIGGAAALGEVELPAPEAVGIPDLVDGGDVRHGPPLTRMISEPTPLLRDFKGLRRSGISPRRSRADTARDAAAERPAPLLALGSERVPGVPASGSARARRRARRGRAAGGRRRAGRADPAQGRRARARVPRGAARGGQGGRHDLSRRARGGLGSRARRARPRRRCALAPRWSTR